MLSTYKRFSLFIMEIQSKVTEYIGQENSRFFKRMRYLCKYNLEEGICFQSISFDARFL